MLFCIIFKGYWYILVFMYGKNINVIFVIWNNFLWFDRLLNFWMDILYENCDLFLNW